MVGLRILASLATLLVCGCTQVIVEQHTGEAIQNSDVKRLFVLAPAEDFFSLPHGLESANSFGPTLQASLQKCEVVAAVFQQTILPLNERAAIDKELKLFHPDSMMTIAHITTLHGPTAVYTYIVTLRNIAQDIDVWKATIVVQVTGGSFLDFSKVGHTFASTLVTQMMSDHLLKVCL